MLICRKTVICRTSSFQRMRASFEIPSRSPISDHDVPRCASGGPPRRERPRRSVRGSGPEQWHIFTRTGNHHLTVNAMVRQPV